MFDRFPEKGTLAGVRETLSENRMDYLFLAPIVLFLVLLMWIPFIRGVWMSLHEWPVLGNYRFLLEWNAFWISIRVTLIFISTTVFQLAVALVGALCVKNMSKFKNVISGSFLIPYTMPPVITGTIWLYLLNPTFGAINLYLADIGVIANTVAWSIYGDLALAVIIFVSTWTFWPFMFLILL
ncbi:MAG: carbohydrate ABC transporter permease, partial [Candidatus Nanohaloarchaea archaeon]